MQKMHDLCDRNGIILWAEIPLVGPGGYAYTGYVSNQGLHDNARQTLKELVFRIITIHLSVLGDI